MKALFEKIELVLAKACALLMLLMVLDVSWQVLSRFVLRDPSSVSEELARFLLIWIGMLGAAYAYRKYAHLGLDIVTARLEGSKKILAERFSDIVSLAFAAIIMVFGGLKIVLLTLELNQISPALEVKIGYVYSIIPISGLLICLFAVERIIYGRPLPDTSVNID